jgi:sec-independent protein translocase protein TatB
MFDIGFSEMIIIGVIALIVLGPEKLPRVARTVGHLLGRMQRYVNDVKADINREVELDELRKLQKEMQNTAQSIEQTVKGEMGAVESEFRQIGDSTQKALLAPVADAFADPPPAVATAPGPASAPSAQLELGLDAAPLANAPPPAIAPAPAAAPAAGPATAKV